MAPTLIKPMENHKMSSPGNDFLSGIFFGYPKKNIPRPPQIINYPDRGPELGGPILRKFTLGWAGPTRRLGLWRNSGPEMGLEAPK